MTETPISKTSIANRPNIGRAKKQGFSGVASYARYYNINHRIQKGRIRIVQMTTRPNSIMPKLYLITHFRIEHKSESF